MNNSVWGKSIENMKKNPEISGKWQPKEEGIICHQNQTIL